MYYTMSIIISIRIILDHSLRNILTDELSFFNINQILPHDAIPFTADS